MRLTGGAGEDVAYDSVGNDTFGGSLAALGVRGHLVSFGQASGPVGNWDMVGSLRSPSRFPGPTTPTIRTHRKSSLRN
ncbi:hypothetical protein EB235_31050 [Mesorhizobium loti R88b]|uniref:Alcohol dehydrogenase-like C-terminal domain-containing protein n=1 Tax=Mesorhizobium loti R88b TaxID=935548 RepID=A0A6M7WTJ0_RHILI|nr:hypothetical protein EB235_31050 [Mesorhizobium loti R88b]